MNNEDQLRYPIGKFVPQDFYQEDDIEQNINRIITLPQQVNDLVKNFTNKHFDTPYREGGWTGRQVVHHLSDSHMNAYIRFKWTLTEETPIIKAYDEKAWAETPEVSLDPTMSLSLLIALHLKLTSLLKLLALSDMQKSFQHPETGKFIRIDRLIAMYAWHGEHHLAHLKIIAGKL